MTSTFNELAGGACCEDSCCWKASYEGCAGGVPYMQVTLVAATTTTIKWLNLNTGDLASTKPDGFVTGSCSDVPANDKVCYAFGADTYQKYVVNSVVTIFKNGVLVTAAADIDAALAVIATATYANIVDCTAAQDNMVCYHKTVTTPSVPGTAQSPANNTILVPSNTQVTTVWDCTTDQMGTAGGSGGFNAPYYVYGGTTPMVVNDDNGMACATNARLDQGDILAAIFQGYEGVVYGVAAGLRKLSADGLGAATVRIDIKKPDGAIITGVASGSSTKQGGAAGWDNFGYYTAGGTFTADQTGTYTMLITGTSVAPVRLNFPEAKVVNAAGEVISSTPETTTVTEYSAITQNGVTKYYDSSNVEITGAALTALLADIAAGTATVGCCTQCATEVTPAVTCKGAHYEQLTLVPGVAQTITHDFAMGNALAIGYSVRGVDGGTVGDWPTGVRFINQTADTVDIIADGIGGVVDVALFNTECLSEVVTEGTTSGGGTSGCGCTVDDIFTGGTDGQVWTVQPDGSYAWETPAGGGTGADTTAAVTSTDGSVDVTSSTTGNTTTYDLSVADPNSGVTGAGGQSMLSNTVGQAANQMIGTTTTTVLLPNSVENTFTNGSVYNAAAGTLTIGETGNYYISYAVRYGTSYSVTAGTSYVAGISLNGTLINTMTVDVEVSVATKATMQVPNSSFITRLNAGDVIRLTAQHTEVGGSKPIYASRGTFLNVARMSGV